jgi:hypothetical protein
MHPAVPTHGLWQGELSFGEVAGVWLMFITSQGDHCLSHVQPWAAERLSTLSARVGKPIRPLDFSDDRLAEMLDRLAKTDPWAAVETGVNDVVLRVYDLGQPSAPIRIDSTSAKTYAEVDAQGLFQPGHSKDHRPDLPQVKISLSTLDPLGLPLTTTVVGGNCADDPLYVAEIKRVQQTVGGGGKTYIGDCKMGALDTRAWIAQSGDYYRCPLAGKQMPAATVEALLAPVFRGEQPLEPVYDPATIADATPPELLAEGYTGTVRLEGQADGQSVTWSEQRLVVRSIAWAIRQGRRLDERLEQALVDITVRRVLAQAGEPLAGLYPWPANRTTATPTAELILRAFRGVSLTVIEVAGRVRAFLSPMSRLQERLLELLGWSTDLYERVVEHFQEPPFNLSELLR